MAASDNERSKRPHLKDLYDHVVVKAARKWKKIGAQLLVNDCTCTAVLNNIEDNCHQQVEKCCEYMLQKWLETNVSASWDELIQALTSPSVQLNHLASEITKMLEMKSPYDDELHWPLNGTFIIELLNQRGDYGHHKKAFLLNDEICTDCTSRPGRNGMSAYGINLISLKALIENTQFYENDNMLLRISYTSCYWCVYLEDATMALVGCVVVSVLDCLCSLVFLAFVVLWKDAQQTLTDFYLALINLVYQHHVIKNAFKSFLCLILLTIMKTMVDIILEQYFGVFTYYHTGFIIWCFVERIAKVYLYLSIANVYSRQCIIVRPFWLLLAFIQTHGPMATAIMVLTVTITNIFAVIAYDML
ncbi:uncharacterized protein [Dysidea avara]|uniref:uncharacterized protein isoform X5 n=1 Tax=Dysidea avara TaxID=196820 RepID=UPI003332C281